MARRARTERGDDAPLRAAGRGATRAITLRPARTRFDERHPGSRAAGWMLRAASPICAGCRRFGLAIGCFRARAGCDTADRRQTGSTMQDSFDITTLIFLALAVFVIWRLRSVLGQKTGSEQPPFDPFSRREPPPAPRPDAAAARATTSSACPGRDRAGRRGRRARAGPLEGHRRARLAGRGRASTRSPRIEPGFDAARLRRRRQGRLRDDRHRLRPGRPQDAEGPASRDVYDGFERAIVEREKRGEKAETTFVSIDKAEIVGVEVAEPRRPGDGPLPLQAHHGDPRRAGQGRRRQPRGGRRRHRRLDLRPHARHPRPELAARRDRSRAVNRAGARALAGLSPPGLSCPLGRRAAAEPVGRRQRPARARSPSRIWPAGRTTTTPPPRDLPPRAAGDRRGAPGAAHGAAGGRGLKRRLRRGARAVRRRLGHAPSSRRISRRSRSCRRRGRGFLTGYFEPEFDGSLTPTESFPAPLLARPDDLVDRAARGDAGRARPACRRRAQDGGRL